MGHASRQQPMRRTVTVKQPRRLPRPVDEAVLEQFIGSLKRLRDLAMFLLMLDGGLRPGEVLSVHLDDISYGRRRATVRKRDDHPRGVRGKSRTERVVDLHEPRTLDAVSRYVMHERPLDRTSPFVFLVGDKGTRRLEPLGYDAVYGCSRGGWTSSVCARRRPRRTRCGTLTPPRCGRAACGNCPCKKRLGHASPESTKVYTRVSEEAVLAEYTRALEGNR
ncbi:tyrosine-type recombinase/integrase [Streptomyces sp. NPDC060027]|uniref:tyrosine-type recombinase/integrase n=1 Tax=Streptomyces sp. NPDC060027 TaxID=3347040 RepID=UPI0036BD3F32